MAEPDTFDLIVVSPDQVVLETKATKVTVPGFIQELAILPHHTPLYSELVKGVIKVETPDGKINEIETDGGLIRVRSNRVSIILGFEAEIERAKPKT